MKKKLTTSRTVNWVIGTALILILGLGILSYLSFNNSFSSVTTTTALSSTASTHQVTLTPIDSEISENLPHKQYQELQDSIKRKRQLINGIEAGNSSQFLFIATQENSRCTNCTESNHLLFMSKDKENSTRDYLVRLFGWKLKSANNPWDNPQYYIRDNQSYLRKVSYTNIKTIKNHTTQTRQEEDVAVPFRVDVDSKDIMIPVSKTTMNIFFYIFLIVAITFILYTIYYVIGSFIKFMIDVAKGNTFTTQNVNRLKFIALNLFLIPCVLFLINLSLPLIFYQYFTDDIVMNPVAWKNLLVPMGLSLIFAALYTAFKKGKQLNDEIELTI